MPTESHPFKSYTFTWWQLVIYETGVLAIGAAIGSHWHGYAEGNLAVLIAVGITAAIYMLSVVLNQ